MLTAGSTLATVAAAVLAPTPLRGLAAAVSLCALIEIWFLQRRAVEGIAQLRVTQDGEILARFGAAADARSMRPLFCAPWLIVLGDRRAALAVWPDGLGEVEFRRLAVASRWGRPAHTA